MNYSELLVLVFSLALFGLVSTFPSLKGKNECINMILIH
jgi:hypothetical protein